MEKPPLHERKPLTTEIELRNESDDAIKEVYVHVGNSGMYLQYIEEGARKQALLNFTPEGHSDPSDKNRIKYATIFGHAFLKLLEWLNDPACRSSVMTEKPAVLENMTNRRMMDYRRNLLGPACEVVSEDPESDKYEYRIDLAKLEDDAETMRRLRALSARAERQGYSMND